MNLYMSNAQKLSELVRMAFERQWKLVDGEILEWKVVDSSPRLYLSLHIKRQTVVSFDDEVEHVRLFVPEIIFDKRFARALFGDQPSMKNPYPNAPYDEDTGTGWHGEGFDESYWNGAPFLYHLQLAVISDNPIDYYYKEIFGNE